MSAAALPLLTFVLGPRPTGGGPCHRGALCAAHSLPAPG